MSGFLRFDDSATERYENSPEQKARRQRDRNENLQINRLNRQRAPDRNGIALER